MTQSDPGGQQDIAFYYYQESVYFFCLGSLPVWVVNKGSKVLVPKVRFFFFHIP